MRASGWWGGPTSPAPLVRASLAAGGAGAPAAGLRAALVCAAAGGRLALLVQVVVEVVARLVLRRLADAARLRAVARLVPKLLAVVLWTLMCRVQ